MELHTNTAKTNVKRFAFNIDKHIKTEQTINNVSNFIA
ncbi:hypothetical protein BvCmsOUP020_04196 [Escherichia coli]|nr:hypothetical protein BvCmsOUP020_04196 [Escherichia coli]